ncbi:MAG TPA: ATP-binding protein, partial [Solirubrobacteraceae bacterium]
DCRCSDAHRTRYARRLSAPLLDRFDLRLRIESPGTEPGPSSAEVRATIEAARARQRSRFANTRWQRNAHIPAGALAATIPLLGDAHEAWVDACRMRRLTGRGAARVRRVARTLADLDGREPVSADDIVRASWLREDVW